MITCRSYHLTLLLALCCFSLTICPGGANMGGYDVEPAPPGTDTGTPLETVKVPVWEYSPQDVAVILAISASPFLLCPLELLFILKLLAALGFRRIRKTNVLDNLSRSRIFHYIQNSPGTDFTEISRETGVSPNSLRYHLAVLKQMNKVSMLETSRNTRYYENSGSYPPIEQKVLRYLHSKPTRTLLKLIKENPNLSRLQLEIALGVSGAGINWHMHRLSDDGILAIRKEGRNARYEINNEAMPYLEKYLPRFDSLPETEGTR
ncbi:MAG: Helix-turn-helix domain protein [Methanoregula sp. PtaU1.Bin051]|nr:MAG: Helix-turn-helix domain protein [Methanoregula sp. PtaU1.Bin051]